MLWISSKLQYMGYQKYLDTCLITELDSTLYCLISGFITGKVTGKYSFLMLCLPESSVQALQESAAAGFGERPEKGVEIYHCNYRRPTQELSSLVISPLLYYQLTNL